MPAVYILTNFTRTVLYTGVTNNLERRMQEHRSGTGSTFTSRYKCTQLVYYEVTDSMIAAITEEKRIKAGSRRGKIRLIEVMNPTWEDLAKDWNI